MKVRKSCKCPPTKFVYRELTEASFSPVAPVNHFKAHYLSQLQVVESSKAEIFPKEKENA